MRMATDMACILPDPPSRVHIDQVRRPDPGVVAR